MRRLIFLTTTFIAVCAAVACGSNNHDATGGSTSSSSSSSGGSTSSSGGGSPSSGGSTSSSSGSGGGSSSSSGTGGSLPTWTSIDLLDDMQQGMDIQHKGNSTVSAIWFKDASHGVVGLLGDEGTFSDGGAIEHMTGPTTIDKVAFSGYGMIAGPQNADIKGLYVTPLGLVAGTNFQAEFLLSKDDGATWTLGDLGQLGGNGPSDQIFLGKSSKGSWTMVDDVGNVWAASQDPATTTPFTRTWQPESNPPVPNPLPAADCQNSFHQGYFARDAQRVFTMSGDGQTMMYPNGLGENPAGVCRSTDGGLNFLPVSFPNPPSAASTNEPYVLFMTSATHGVAARSNDAVDGDSFVYTTDDGGATWKAGTLPTSVTAAGSHAAIVSGFAAPDGQHMWLVGFTLVSDAQGLLLKSTDGGSTWTDISAKLAAVPAAANKLHTGFALDANNIWIGGAFGTLLYSPSGGE